MERLLLEITLEGFKSFRDRTVIKFDGSFTAIVGPNGSGKSNIVDAVKWVLGDQSPRSVRAATGQEAIFRPGNGGAEEGSGFASVAIKIDNSQTSNPDEPMEYEIERRYYRSGESVYTINGKVARLKDVRAIMAQKGFGLGSLSVVSQGDIDGFLSLVPSDRRLVFEDLARISDFKSNKRKILNQLEESNRNLQRLQDLIAEIRVRCEQLGVQAIAARNHAELTYQRNELLAQLAAQEYILAKRNVERHETRLQDLREGFNEAVSLQAEAAKALEEAKAEYSRIKVESASIFARCEEGRRELERARAEEQRLIDACGHLGRLAHTLEEELNERIKRKENIQNRIAEAGKICARANADRLWASRRKLEFDLFLVRKWGFMRCCDRERERLSSKVERLAGESNLFTRDAEFHARRADSLTAELSELKHRRSEIQIDLERLKSESGSLSSRLNELKKRLEQRTSEYNEIIAEIRTLSARKMELDNKRSELSAQIAVLEKEHSILFELEESREGYGEGVRAILEKREEFPGLYGSLAELFEPERGKEIFIERILGDSIQYLVCESLPDAVRIIEAALKNKLGAVTCIVRDMVPAFNCSDSGDDSLPIFSADEKFMPVLAMFLGRAKEIRSLTECTDIDFKEVLISTEGEIFRPPAFVSGGAIYSLERGILTRKAKLEELGKLLGNVRESLDSIVELSEKLGNEAQCLETKAEELRAEISLIENEIKSVKAEIERFNETHALLLKEQESINKRLCQLAEELDACNMSAKYASASVESINRIRISTISDLERLEREISSLRNEVEDLRARLQSAIVEEASYEEEIARALKDIERLKIEFSECEEEISRRQNRLSELKAEARGKSAELDAAVSRRENLEGKLPELEDLEKETGEKLAKLEETVLIAEEFLEKSRKNVSSLEESVHTQELRLAELKGALPGLEKGLEIYPEFASRIFSGDWNTRDIPSKKELIEKLEEVEAEIQKLGAVNPLAIQEEEYAKARLDELTRERMDLISAEEDLRTALEEIEHESRSAFLTTFNETRSKFSEVFSSLFPGGSAELRLTDSDDPLESGIDINVRFPGKGELDLLQFSGGERSLVALALLFAILKVKPSSFTVLDEVEAALDDINTQKFLDYLGNEFSDRQFIIVTHNKITMERANRLYGVTMREGGISQVVSVDLRKLSEEVSGEISRRPN